MNFIFLALIFVPLLNSTLVRFLAGAVLLLYLPGYALIAAVFPEKDTIDVRQRIALSIGISVVVSILDGIFVGLIHSPLSLELVVFSLTFIILVSVFTAQRRRQALPREERFSPEFQAIAKEFRQKITSAFENRKHRTLAVLVAISLTALVLLGSYVMATQPREESYTSFYLLNSNGEAQNYPTEYKLNESQSVIVGVHNNEQRTETYTLKVLLNDSAQSTVLYQETISINNGQTWQKNLTVKPDRIGTDMKLDFRLFIDNGAMPYKETYLWITVS
jgi:uncharacterized membrane protein